MPQPSTQPSALDSVLSQFAAASDELNSRPLESNGERREENGSAPAPYLNGHGAELETVEVNGRLEEHLRHVVGQSENGATGRSAVEPTEPPPSIVHRGNGAAYTNGSAAIETSLHGAMAEILATTAPQSNSSLAAEANGSAAVEIGEPPVPPADEAEEPRAGEAEEPQVASNLSPESVSEHPAAGSLFTPYLVTEIRELRNRCRRRSWWRRLFG